MHIRLTLIFVIFKLITLKGSFLKQYEAALTFFPSNLQLYAITLPGEIHKGLYFILIASYFLHPRLRMPFSIPIGEF